MIVIAGTSDPVRRRARDGRPPLRRGPDAIGLGAIDQQLCVLREKVTLGDQVVDAGFLKAAR